MQNNRQRSQTLRLWGSAAMIIAVVLQVAHAFFGKFNGTSWYFPVVFILQLTFLAAIFASIRIDKRSA